MDPPQQVIPSQGVYAGLVEIADTQGKLLGRRAKTPAALSIGTSATYGDTQALLIEAHLFEKDVGDLYGKQIAMDFIRRIRPQQKFNSESQLADQIAKDCREAKDALAAYSAK